MRDSQALRGRPHCILARRLLQKNILSKKKKKEEEEEEEEEKEPKGDEYIVAYI